MAWASKEKQLKCQREWYKRNRERHKANVAEDRRRRYRENRSIVDEIKVKAGCIDCKKSYPAHVLDFDHVRDKKRFNIGNAIHSSLETLYEEIAKCDIVCANCHRERTHKRKHASVG